jgi:hypothetical protein
MALPAEGAISMSQIKAELGSTSNILRVYSEAAGKTAPHGMKEFLGYSKPGPPPPPPPPPPPAPTYYSFAAVRSTVSAQDACDSLGPIITVYSTCQTLIVNCVLRTYFDAEPEILRTVQSGWYSIGDNWYYVNNNSGIINSTGVCGTGGCECYTVYNESGDRSIIFEYNRCSDGAVSSLSVARGSVVTVCVSPGGDVYDTSGLLTIVACGTPCSVNGDCTDCI